MATNSVYDGLHVQRLEDVQTPPQRHRHHISEAYKPVYAEDAKEVANSTASPYYYNQAQQQYLISSHPPPPFPHDETNPRRNPWGLSPLAFAALIALITAIIVGAAVGGGVSAATSKKDCSSTATPTTTAVGAGASTTGTSTSTSTSTSSASTVAPTGTFRNYIPPDPSNVESLYNNCDALNGSSFQSQQGSMFRLTCPQAILGSSGSGGVTLSELVAYTLDDCINACTLMNFWKGSTVCNSVTWDNGMAGATAANFGGNCWLFNNSTTFQVKANSTSARMYQA